MQPFLRRHSAPIAATAALLLAGGARGELLTYPGPAPCDTSVQACIQGADAGDEIELAVNGAIDESLNLTKSITLRAAEGFAPVIDGSAMTRVLGLSSLGSTGSNQTVVVEGLVFDNARIDGLLSQGSGHTVIIRNNVFLFEIEHNNTAAIALDLRNPGEILVEGNRITSTGPGVRIMLILPEGSAHARVERNVIDTSLPAQSYVGIEFDLRGSGSYAVEAFSNAVDGVGGCNCGRNAGIAVDLVEAVEAVASITHNTVHGTETASAFHFLVRDAGASLALRLFNNSASNSDHYGYELSNIGDGSVAVEYGANNAFENAEGAVLWAPQLHLTAFDPLYVDAPNGDLRLAEGSELVDAGDDEPQGGTSTLDAGGDLRLQGVHVDVGAYEQAPEPGGDALGLGVLASLSWLRRRCPRRIGAARNACRGGSS
jgi:hypothetical protein